jgi:hypothetical protein
VTSIPGNRGPTVEFRTRLAVLEYREIGPPLAARQFAVA